MSFTLLSFILSYNSKAAKKIFQMFAVW